MSEPPPSPEKPLEETADEIKAVEPTPAEPESSQPSSFKLYFPPSSNVATPAELPESFFEPTTGELQAAFAGQHRKSERLSNAPLRTQAIRQQEEKSRLKKWPNTTIRVKFPDRTQLERSFPSTEKIRSVYAFVRSSLREDVKPSKFILYQSPPRVEFKVSDPAVRDLSLAELSLSPSSVLLLSFIDDELNSKTTRAPLSEEMWSQAQNLPPPPTFDAPKQNSSKNNEKKSGGGEKTGMPKWLKLGKK